MSNFFKIILSIIFLPLSVLTLIGGMAVIGGTDGKSGGGWFTIAGTSFALFLITLFLPTKKNQNVNVNSADIEKSQKSSMLYKIIAIVALLMLISGIYLYIQYAN